MEHILPPLPFEKNALEPHISAETMEFHYGKHHRAYVEKLNQLIKGTKFEGWSLEKIIEESDGPIFNNAAQVWNHTFFWETLRPSGTHTPAGRSRDLIEKKWGSFEKFQEAFTNSAVNNFGSGWTWLVMNKSGEVDIMNTSNADTPKKHGIRALMTIDVWEHAYYIDYRNARKDFVQNFWKLVNWDFVEKNLNQT